MEVVHQTYMFLLLVHSVQTESEFKLDNEEQESDPKPPLPPTNLSNPNIRVLSG